MPGLPQGSSSCDFCKARRHCIAAPRVKTVSLDLGHLGQEKAHRRKQIQAQTMAGDKLPDVATNHLRARGTNLSGSIDKRSGHGRLARLKRSRWLQPD
jgi:hypothetical protein